MSILIIAVLTGLALLVVVWDEWEKHKARKQYIREQIQKVDRLMAVMSVNEFRRSLEPSPDPAKFYDGFTPDQWVDRELFLLNFHKNKKEY